MMGARVNSDSRSRLIGSNTARREVLRNATDMKRRKDQRLDEKDLQRKSSGLNIRTI